MGDSLPKYVPDPNPEPPRPTGPPWEYHPRDKTVGRPIGDDWGETICHLEEVGEVVEHEDGRRSLPRMDANGRLIAASLEMVGLLRMALGVMAKGYPPSFAWQEQARELIAKVETPTDEERIE